MAIQTTASLSAEMKTYYWEDAFLRRAMPKWVHGQGAQKGTQSKGEGASKRFTRINAIAPVVTPLTEGVNPAEADYTEANVDVTLREYGLTTKLSKFLSMTTIDRGNAEKISALGDNMGNTLDNLIREILFAGATVKYANNRAGLVNVVAGDVINTTEIRKILRELEKTNTEPYDDGMFMGKLGPDTKFDFTGDTTFVNAKAYSDVGDLYRGELGSWSNVRLMSANNQRKETSTTTVYSNFFHGKNAFGDFDLEGDQPTLYIKTPNEHDTSNPADRFSTAAWAGTWGGVILNAAFIFNLKTAASA